MPGKTFEITRPEADVFVVRQEPVAEALAASTVFEIHPELRTIEAHPSGLTIEVPKKVRHHG